MLNEIFTLIQKEYLIEFKEKSALNAVLLYTISITFICYLSFGNAVLDAKVWVVLYWIMITFSAFNAVAKTFLGTSESRNIYYFTIANPIAIIASKIIYNTGLVFAISTLGYIMFWITISSPIVNFTYFGWTIVLSSLGFSGILTLLSGIAAKTGSNGHMLMSILGLPLILPLLLIVIRISKGAVKPDFYLTFNNDLLVLGSIDCIVITLSLLLFPYLWRS